MSGRDFGRGGDRRGGFEDRDEGRGGFRDRGPRPWERRDDERPPRSFGDRPFERTERPERPERTEGPEQERDVRVERYYDEPQRPPRENRPPRGDRPFRDDRPFREDRPPRFGGDRDGGDRFRRDGGMPSGRPGGAPVERPVPPAPAPAAPAPAAAVVPTPPAAPPAAPRHWTPLHLIDSWNDEEKLKGWTPTDQEVQELVEDNIEGDPLVPGRDRRAIAVQARGGIVTLVGAVRNRIVKFAAGSDAYWSYGVKEVRNELEIKPRGAQAAAAASEPTLASAAIEAPEPVAPKRATRRKATVEPEPEVTETPVIAEGEVEFEARPEAETE